MDDTIKVYIEEVKEFMKSSGISKETVNSRSVIGLITIGVSDLWVNNSRSLSPYFMQRLTELRLEE